MREILFRGKRVDNGEWVYGSKYNDFIICYLEVDKFLEESDLFSCNCVIHEVNKDTIGQFTGLTDKKGNKIFEGDKVHYNDKPYNVYGLKTDGIVINYKGSWAIKHQASFTSQVHFLHKLFSSEDFIGRKSEIIGNIHDKQSDHEKDR